MEIKISDTKKITTDKLNYIYCERIGKNKKRWKQVWFYNTLMDCYTDLLDELTRSGDKKTLKENVEEAVNMLEEIKNKALEECRKRY